MQQPKPRGKSRLLYDAVSDSYDVGTFEEFNSKLLDPKKRRAFYNGVSQEFELGTYEEFETKLLPSLKKKSSDSSQRILANQESVSPSPTENISSDTSEPERTALEKGLDFAKDLFSLRMAQGKDALEHLKAASMETLASFSGIPNFINKIKFNTTLGTAKLLGIEGAEDFEQRVNDLPEVEREKLIGQLESANNTISGALGQVSAAEQNYLTDVSEEIREKTIQYEGNILDDIREGRVEQAAARVANGAAGSIPSIIMAAMPGGILAIGAGAASQKQEQLDREGEDLDTNSILNSLVTGTAEGVFESVTAGLLKPLKGVLKGNRELANQFSESFTGNMLKSVGLEASSEAMTEITQQLSDDLFYGREDREEEIDALAKFKGVEKGSPEYDKIAESVRSTAANRFWKNVADAALVGGITGGGISTVTLGAARVMDNDSKKQVKEIDKTILDIDADLQQDIPENIKESLRATKDKLVSKKGDMELSAYERFKSLPKEERLKLGDLESKLEAIRKEHDQIKENPDISEDSRKMLLAERVEEAKKLLDKKLSIAENRSEVQQKISRPEVENPQAVKANENNVQPESEGAVKDDVPAKQKGHLAQLRSKELEDERIAFAKRPSKSGPKKLNEIIANVGKDLKATLIYGKTPGRRAAGSFDPSNSLVKIGRAGDLDTVAHEIGHLIDDRYDIVGNSKGKDIQAQLTSQLKWFSDRGGSNPPSDFSAERKKAYLQREGMGEFIRAYIANPEVANKVAPELFSHFERTVDQRTLDILKQFSEDYLDFANASYGDQILSNVDNSLLSEKKGFKEWLDGFRNEDGNLSINFFDRFQANWTNSMAIPNKVFRYVNDLKGKSEIRPEENFEMMSRLFAGINGKINSILANGLVDGKGNIIKDDKGLTMNVEYLLEALDHTDQSTLKKEMDEVIKFLIAERTVEYAKRFERSDNLTGIGAGILSDLEISEGHLRDFEELSVKDQEKYTRIKESARRYRAFADAGLRYSLDKGRISQKDYELIKSSNQYYVSLARIEEISPGEELLPFLSETGKITSVRDVVKKAKGGSRAIQNPYQSLIQNTVKIIKESDRNEVMASFVEPLSNNRDIGEGQQLDFSKVARIVASGEKNSIKVFVKGEPQRWQFSQEIYEALKGLEGIAHNRLFDLLAKPADLIRFTVTNFPVFAARNAFRDTFSRLIVSRSNGTIRDLLHNERDKRMFELFGGSQAGFYLTNKEAYKEVMNQAVKNLAGKGGAILDPRKLSYNRYRNFLQKSENLNRVAEYRSAYRKAKREGMDDYNAGLYAAYQARDLMDFAVAGNYMQVINKLVPFSNAGVQSIKRSVKGLKEDPGGFALKIVLYTVLPQIASRALVSAMGDDEEYEELPDWQRDLFWNFKTPLTGDLWISLPKPFELGLPSSLLDRAYSKVKGNDDAFDGAWVSAFKAMMPFDEAAMLGSLKPLVEVSTNYDMFRDREIVPYYEKNKDIAFRSGTKYASRIGQGLTKAFGLLGLQVDPRGIDHVINGYTTYFGKFLLAIGDIGREDSRNQLDFTKTGFARGMPVGSAKSVRKALNLARSMGVENRKNIKVLKGMVKAWYELEDPEKKKILSEQIYGYSRRLIPALKQLKKKKLETAKD
ncbi:LPD38 domain-containing protein [Ulvibacterium sp.]|uniref:LPD38 domain-containing protein n=1 Tax=Ulvibacterium sp. TaxID=2665914 RepID=UPI00261317C5|nr:LPD38 domain-containing protein [Ulvibacterium sp.]